MRQKDVLRARRRPRRARGFKSYLDDCRAVDLTVGSNRNARNILPVLADLGCPASCVAALLGCYAETVIGWHNKGAELPVRIYELLLYTALELVDHASERDRQRQELHNCKCATCTAYKAGKAVPTLMDAFQELAR